MALETADGSIVIDTKVDQSELDVGLSSMQTKATKVAFAIAASMTAAIAGVSKAVIDIGSEYETSLAKTSTLFGNVEVDTDSLTAQILELSSATGESAAELNEGLYQALSAGVAVTEDMTDATGFLDTAVKLAKGGFTTTASSVDLLTTTMNAYGDSAGTAEEIADMLINTQNKGKTTIDELSSSMGRVIPTAAAYNVSLSNLTTSLATMTASGIATAEATTYMRSMLSELADTGSGVSTVLKEKTGKSFSELMDEGYSLGDVLGILSDSVDGNATAFANLWSSQEAGTGALSIVNTGVENFNSTLKDMENSTGSTEDAYEKMTDTVATKGAKITETFKNIGIEVFDKFEEPVSDAFDSAQKTLSDFSDELARGELDDSIDKVGDSIGGLIDKGTELAVGAIPVVIDAFTFMTDNSNVLLAATGALTAGMIVHNNVQLLTNTYKTAAALADIAYSSAMAVASGEMGVMAASQLALNTVMAANPVGLVITGVAALAAGIGILAATYEDTKTPLEENIQALNDEAEAYAEVQQAAQDRQDASMIEIGNIQAMKNELDNLVDSDGKVQEGFENRASFLVNELAEATGSDIALVDGQIENYGELSGAIDEAIEKMRAEALLQAHTEEYQTALENQSEALKTLREVTQDYNEYQKTGLGELEAAEAEYNAAKDSGDSIRLENARANWVEQQAIYDEHQTALDQAQTNYDAYTQTISDYEQAKTDILQGEYDTVNDIYDASSEALLTSTEDKKQYLQDELDEELLNLDSLKRSRTDANADMIDGEIKAGEDRIAELKDSLDGLVDTVEDKTPAYVDANGDISQAGLDAFKDISYESAGKNAVDGVLEGAESKKSSLWSKFKSLASSALSAFQTGIDSHSPSKAFKKIAKWIVPGINEAVDEDIPDAEGKMQELASSMVDSFDPSEIDGSLNIANGSMTAAQNRFATEAMAANSYKVSNTVNNTSEARNLRGSFSGVIENRVYIGDRETAVALAPFISEEIEFNE